MNTTEILNKFTDGGVLSYTELRRKLYNHIAFRETWRQYEFCK